MSWKQEEYYKLFKSHLKILEWRANDKAREEKSEEAKKLSEEYKELRLKLEAIEERRHYAMITEENRETILRKEFLAIVEEEYQKIDIHKSNKFEEVSQGIYREIKAKLEDYQLVKKKQKSEIKEIEEEER